MHFPVVLVLMSLVACGKNNSSKPNEEKFVRGLNCLQTPEALCTPKMRWFINTKEEGFPTKFSLSLNGATVFNECREDEVSTSINIPTEPGRAKKSFKLDGAIKMKQYMKLEIVDCRTNAPFYSSDAVAIAPFDYSEEDDWFVSQSVYVKLEN